LRSQNRRREDTAVGGVTLDVAADEAHALHSGRDGVEGEEASVDQDQYLWVGWDYLLHDTMDGEEG
jgi:hypothetical protein